MKRKKTYLFAAMLISVVFSTFSCSKPAVPAQFDISAFIVQPQQATIGDTISASVQVTNSGASDGIYETVLTIDGKRADSKAVSLSPGASNTVSFSIPANKAGTFKVGIGDLASTVTVNAKRASKPTELKYDDGTARDFLSVDKPCTGYIISYTPPGGQFTIDTVRIYGLIYGGHGFIIPDIELRVMDKDKKVLYSGAVDKSEFPLLAYLPTDIEKQGGWVDVDIPDTTVNGTFYIQVYTGVSTGQGFRMGADDSVKNTHSDVTVRNSAGIDNVSLTWPYPISSWFGDKSNVNWMIRVSGWEWTTELQ